MDLNPTNGLPDISTETSNGLEGIYSIKLRLVFTGDGVGVGVVSGVVTERLAAAALGDSTELFPINWLKLTRLKNCECGRVFYTLNRVLTRLCKSSKNNRFT